MQNNTYRLNEYVGDISYNNIITLNHNIHSHKLEFVYKERGSYYYCKAIVYNNACSLKQDFKGIFGSRVYKLMICRGKEWDRDKIVYADKLGIIKGVSFMISKKVVNNIVNLFK